MPKKQAVDYKDCIALIYDDEGNQLDSIKIASYDKDLQYIFFVRDLPEEIQPKNSFCNVLILTQPSPREYRGKSMRYGTGFCLALFEGKNVEKRTATRYKTDIKGSIRALVYDEKPYSLHTPVDIECMNISKGGLRFRAPYETLIKGHIVQLHLELKDIEGKISTVMINNILDRKNIDITEYGCNFVTGKV